MAKYRIGYELYIEVEATNEAEAREKACEVDMSEALETVQEMYIEEI